MKKKSGVASSFTDYVNWGDNVPFEIEHIWANKYRRHQKEFKQRDEFDFHRNLIGGLLLIQRGQNQSFNALTYEKKLPYYLRENLLAQSLHPKSYEKNPNFNRYIKASGLPFRAHKTFSKGDFTERQELYKKICEEIWNVSRFDDIVEG